MTMFSKIHTLSYEEGMKISAFFALLKQIQLYMDKLLKPVDPIARRSYEGRMDAAVHMALAGMDELEKRISAERLLPHGIKMSQDTVADVEFTASQQRGNHGIVVYQSQGGDRWVAEAFRADGQPIKATSDSPRRSVELLSAILWEDK